MNELPAKRVQALFGRFAIDALVVQDPGHRRWLTGYDSVYQRAYVVVTEEGATVVTYGYGLEQARLQSGGMAAVGYDEAGAVTTIAGLLEHAGVGTVGFDSDVSATIIVSLAELGFNPQPCTGIMNAARTVKTPAEIARFRAVANLHDRALEHVDHRLSAGMTEAEVRAELDSFLLKNGAEGFTFETVVLAGERAVHPHLRPGDRELRRGDLVTVDFGAILDGADCDVCRTYVVGEPTQEMVDLYSLVWKAHLASIDRCRPGVAGGEVDQTARDVLASAGMAQYFNHSLGHGLSGGPRIGPGSTDALVPGAIVAVEPGIYRPGWGGMRVEDAILITEEGPEKLTHHDGQRLKVIG